MRTTVSARGPLSADEAWERYADLDAWPRWAPQITGVTAPARRLVPGLEGVVRAAGVVHVPFTVLAVDEAARTWSWRVRVGPVRLVLQHGVEHDDGADGTDDGDGAGSRTWLITEGPALVVAPYTPVALVALHSLVRP
ncbi:SRPBCC family protein [Actinomycetospora chiangmaiensis]|uniref:SRPBCC family protein n=1 Tax=Actinomycetospora chiangmaiensis TaxID=402650 RepID=UPI0003801981|nr:SRPBCC family protein [Actinomycetospora chiangmaiensis]